MTAVFLAYLKSPGSETRIELQKWHGDQKTGAGQFKRGAVGTGDLLDFFKLEKYDEYRDLKSLEEIYPYIAVSHYSNKFMRRETTIVAPKIDVSTQTNEGRN